MTIPMIDTLAAYTLVPPVEAFDLPRVGQSNTIKGLHTGRGSFIWKRYVALHTAQALDYELALLTRLAGAGLSFAVPAPVPTHDGRLWLDSEAGRISLTPLLPGRTLDPSTRGMVDPAEVALYGGAVGELHAALAQLPATPRPGRSLFNDLFTFSLPHVEPLALQPEQLGIAPDQPMQELFGWWRGEVARLRAWCERSYSALPQQVCHNDLSPANILVDNGRVSAVLDFEFATTAPRALDIAMSLRMATRTWEDPEPWQVVRTFMCAYTRWMPFSAAEAAAMPELLRLRTLLPTLWWLERAVETADHGIIVRGMGFLQRTDRWLQGFGAPFVRLLHESTHEK